MEDPDRDAGARTRPVFSDRDKLVHNEQVKLTATTVNGVALAFIVGGGVTTMIGFGTAAGSADQFLRACAWIMTGFILHLAARFFLRTLR